MSDALVVARSANTARVRVTTGRVRSRTALHRVGEGSAAGLEGGAEGGAGGVKGAFVRAGVEGRGGGTGESRTWKQG